MGAKDCCLMGLREEMGGASSKELPRALFIGGDMEVYGSRIGVVEVIWGVMVVAADWSKKGGIWLHLRPRNCLSKCISCLGKSRRNPWWLFAHGKLRDQLLIYFDMNTQMEVQLATEINNLTRQLVDSIDERCSFIQELECFPGNVMAYKTGEELKGPQKDDLIKVIEMRTIASQIIPGPAGIVQTAKLRKIDDTREGGEESIMSTLEYIRKVIEDVGEDDDFTRVSWLSMLDYVNVDGGIVTGYFGDAKKFLKNGKLEKVVAVIKSCTPNAMGDHTITLKDLSSTISGTIHYKVLIEERFAKAITIGAALILHNVSVFYPKQLTHHYLNITKKNMVKVFHKDGRSA
ncbi:hypothetical protein Tco_1402197 [Tanacetum coccineum]